VAQVAAWLASKVSNGKQQQGGAASDSGLMLSQGRREKENERRGLPGPWGDGLRSKAGPERRLGLREKKGKRRKQALQEEKPMGWIQFLNFVFYYSAKFLRKINSFGENFIH
jgi:hypothetical protein